MKVIVFGATGMVGQGVLRECLEDPGVEAVLVVGRNACGVTHPKLRELLKKDLYDYADVEKDLAGYDACFFCLGITSAGMSEPDYHHITYDLTLAAARTLVRVSPGMTFIYVSGAGTDSSEKGRSMWARVKGQTENALLGLGFARAVMFRPGIIQPMHGARSKTALYHAFYVLSTPLFPVLRGVAPGLVTTTEKVGKAMLKVARDGSPKTHLENRDINALAAG